MGFLAGIKGRDAAVVSTYLDQVSEGEKASTVWGKLRMIVDIAADGRLTDGDVRVAVALLFRFHNTKEGKCCPSYETIARTSVRKKRAAINSVGRLTRTDWLSVRERPGTSNDYLFPKLSAYSGASTYTALVQQAAPGECATMHPTSASSCTQTQELNTGKKHKKGTQAASARAALESDFEIWWDAYGKKVGKPAALTAYVTAREKADAKTLLAGARREAAGHGRDRTYQPNPTTWLRQERWADEYHPQPKPDPYAGAI